MPNSPNGWGPDSTQVKQALLDSNMTTSLSYIPVLGMFMPKDSKQFPRMPQDMSDNESISYKDAEIRGYLNNLSTKTAFLNDPTFLGFSVLFDFYDSPLFKGTLGNYSNNGTTFEANDIQSNFPIDSAIGYLERTDKNRIKYLKQFSNRLKLIQDFMPWYWQSIEGLGRAYTASQNFIDPFKGGDDAKITITTLESIDLTITGLIDLYRKACFNFPKTRQVVPTNLEKFDVQITVKDIRKFRANQNSEYSNPTDMPSLNTPYVVFKFIGCEFSPTDDGKMYDVVSNQQNEMITGSLSFTYKDIEMLSGDYPWLDFDISEGPEFNIQQDDKNNLKLGSKFKQVETQAKTNEDVPKFNFKEFVKEFAKSKLNDIKKASRDLLPTIISTVGAYIPNYLGNVYTMFGIPTGIPIGLGMGAQELGNLVTDYSGQAVLSLKGIKKGPGDFDGYAALNMPRGTKSYVQLPRNKSVINERNMNDLELKDFAYTKTNVIDKNMNDTELKDFTYTKTNVMDKNKNAGSYRLGKIDIMTPNDTPKYNIINGKPNVYHTGTISNNLI